MSIADVAVISSCRPMFVTVAAFLILGEPFGLFLGLMTILTMVGVGVITRPPILTGKESFDGSLLVSLISFQPSTRHLIIDNFFKIQV